MRFTVGVLTRKKGKTTMKKLIKLLSSTLALTLVLASTATAAAPEVKEEAAAPEKSAIVAIAEDRSFAVEEIEAAEEKAAVAEEKAPVIEAAEEKAEVAEEKAPVVEVAEEVAEVKEVLVPEVTNDPNEAYLYTDGHMYVKFYRDAQELKITGEGRLPDDFWKYLVSVDKMDAMLKAELEAYYGVDVIRVSADTNDPFEFAATNEYIDAATGETLYVTEDMIGSIDFSKALEYSPKSVVISEGIENIPTYAFAFCTELTEIVLPSTIKHIGEGAFAFCTGLKSITLPESVASIYLGAFDGCVNLETIQIAGYDNAAEAQFYGTKANLITGTANETDAPHCEFIA